MEPANKKARLTDHFRVALRPRDLNVGHLKRKQTSKQQIEIITIGDDGTSQGEIETSKQQQIQQGRKSDENSTRSTSQQGSQQQTLPLKLVTSSQQQLHRLSQPPQLDDNSHKQLKPSQSLHQNHQQQQQQPRLHLGPLVVNTNDHGRAINKGNKSSITSCFNNANNPKLGNNKSITSYLIKPEPSPLNKYLEPPGRHSSVFDYDKTLLNNIYWEPHYAWESFEYDRQQEIKFKNTRPIYLMNDRGGNSNASDSGDQLYHEANYLLSADRRAELVDWLVDIQINFDLDHEPLYMAVKLVDQYLMRKHIPYENNELLFMVSMLVAAKFDERIPPITISELIDVAQSRFGIRYTRKQVVSLEVDLLTTLQFDIRFPLSYGFLRRFARCTRSDTRTLYLARYILECSLMDQDMIEVIESKLAAGSLLLAFNMLHKTGAWDETARYYTKYDEHELTPLAQSLERMIHRLSKRKTAIRSKYSHEPYMGVARIPFTL